MADKVDIISVNDLPNNIIQQQNNNLNKENELVVSVNPAILDKIKIKKFTQRAINLSETNRFKQVQDSQFQVNVDKSSNRRDLKRISQFHHIFNITYESNSILRFCYLIPIIDPANKLKLLWDFIQMMVIMILIFCIPIHITYDIPICDLLNGYFAQCIALLLILDIIISLNTSYFEKGIVILDRIKIIKRFFISCWLTDIVSCLPVIINIYQNCSCIDQTQNYVPTENLKYLTLFFFFKINHISQIFRKIEESLQLKERTSNILSLFRLLYAVIFVGHMFTVLWLYFPNVIFYQQKSWLDRNDLRQEPWWSQYLNAFYFVTTTMITVGYGDMVATTSFEKFLSICTMMISCGVFAYSVNKIGEIFQNLFKLEQEIRVNMNIINNYMVSKKINEDLQNQVREYLEYYWREESSQNVEQEEKIINKLSDGLREMLLMQANKIVLSDSKVFMNNFSETIIQKTVPLIKEYRSLPQDIIYEKGDIDDCCIYFIEKGAVEIFTYSGKPKSKIKQKIQQIAVLKQGQSFGALSFFLGEPRDYCIRSLDFTRLLMIKRNDFLTLIKDYPNDYERFCQIRDKLGIQKSYSIIGLKCSSCQSFDHQIIDCPLIHYAPNKQGLIKKECIGFNNERNKDYNRKIKIKSKTFRDLYVIEYQCLNYQEQHDSDLETYEKEKMLKQDLDQSEDEDDSESEMQQQSTSNADQEKEKDKIPSTENTNSQDKQQQINKSYSYQDSSEMYLIPQQQPQLQQQQIIIYNAPQNSTSQKQQYETELSINGANNLPNNSKSLNPQTSKSSQHNTNTQRQQSLLSRQSSQMSLLSQEFDKFKNFDIYMTHNNAINIFEKYNNLITELIQQEKLNKQSQLRQIIQSSQFITSRHQRNSQVGIFSTKHMANKINILNRKKTIEIKLKKQNSQKSTSLLQKILTKKNTFLEDYQKRNNISNNNKIIMEEEEEDKRNSSVYESAQDAISSYKPSNTLPQQKEIDEGEYNSEVNEYQEYEQQKYNQMNYIQIADISCIHNNINASENASFDNTLNFKSKNIY